MAVDLSDNEDVIKVAGVIAAVVSAIGIFAMWRHAPDLLDKIVVILKAVSIGVGLGVAFFVGVLLLRLLIRVAYATGNAIAAGIDWIIETTLNLFVGMIRAILMAPLVLLGMIWGLVRPEKPKAKQRTKGEGAGRSQQNDGGRQEQHQRQSGGGFSDANMTEKQALEVFELSRPYTLEKLKARRMELMKKVHPDQGGSNMMARMVNEAYEVLKARV